jgi:aryl-alcohol dehydrogenase-like predicted oxidoreductase
MICLARLIININIGVTMITRRQYLKASAAITLSTAMGLDRLRAQSSQPLIMRAIPKTGELLPAIGLGSSANFSNMARNEDFEAVRSVMSALHTEGGRIFDTAPSYGASEEVSASIANELNIHNELFWATKLNAVERGSDRADPSAARDQLETSFTRINRQMIDLIQVHNVSDVATHLPILKEYVQEGRVRYVGNTTWYPEQYEDLKKSISNDELDFIGIDYAIDNRSNGDDILPLAMDHGVAVLVYAPFGRDRLWSRVAGVALPEWASEIGAETWAQFFLKFVLAHPAVTAATPSTSRPANMIDNMGACYGELPDEAVQKRMLQFIDALPDG